MAADLVTAISELDEDTALSLVDDLMKRETDPMTILESVRTAMEIVGRRYEEGRYFLPELIMSGEIMSGIKRRLSISSHGGKQPAYRGRVVIGTVEGDIHNIGKDIVSFMLDSNGFEVIDLGVDVPAYKFVDSIRQYKPGIVGLSAFLTLAYDVMKRTIEEFEKAGLRREVKVMIGGGQIDERVRQYTGADEYGKTAMDAVALAGAWVGR